MAETKRRALDFYLKGLDLDVQRDIHHHIKNDFTEMDVKYLKDGPNGYKNVFKEGIFSSEEEIAPYLEDQKRLFDSINLRMVKKKRYPLFSNTDDLSATMDRRTDLLSFIPESECCKIVGCNSYATYTPKIFEGPEREAMLKKLIEKCGAEPEQPQPGAN